MDANVTGSIIAAKRKEKGLNQIQLGEMLNVSNRTISKWENGDGFPDISILPELARVLDITIDELLTGNTPEPIIVEIEKEEKPNTLKKARGKFLISEIISYSIIIAATLIGVATEVAFYHMMPFYAFIEIYLVVGAAIMITIGIIVYFTGLIKYKMEADKLSSSIVIQNYIISLIASLSPACIIFRISTWLNAITRFNINGYLIRYIFAGIYVIAIIVSTIIIFRKTRSNAEIKNEKDN